MRQRLFKPKKHSGWMCAQKRPLDGLHKVLQKYAQPEYSIPDYLFLVDDDTYINTEALISELLKDFPVEDPLAVAGCNFSFLRQTGFTFPYRGLGTFLTKAAVQRLIQPFYCDGREGDEFSNRACERLTENAMGEKQFYKLGMSVADLMQAYSSGLPFTGVESWTDTGYCMHSDHALAYFVNFYYIPVPDNAWSTMTTTTATTTTNDLTDNIRRQHSFVGLDRSQCGNDRDNCNSDSLTCHYVQPQKMDELHGTSAPTSAK
jgi:hypothetical protein